MMIFKGTNFIFKLRKTKLSSTFRKFGNFPQPKRIKTINVTKMQVFILKTKILRKNSVRIRVKWETFMFGSNRLSIQKLSWKQSCDHMSPVSGCGLSSVGGVAKQ